MQFNVNELRRGLRDLLSSYLLFNIIHLKAKLSKPFHGQARKFTIPEVSWNIAQDLHINQSIKTNTLFFLSFLKECIYLKEGKQLVPIDDQLKTLVVNQGKKPRIPQLIFDNRQFL